MFNKTRNKIRNNSKSLKRKTRYWVISVTTAGIVFAFTVGNSRAMNIGFKSAENKPAIERFYDDKDRNNMRRFDIAPGLLSEVVDAFSKASGWRIQLGDDVKDIQSPGVVGDYTEEQALKLILQNTGVTYTILSPQNVSLKLQGPAETVEVVDENSTLLSPKYTEPLRDIPQTVSIIDSKTIEEQNATTLRDVLRNVPGLTIAAGEGGVVGGDNINLRGFSARNDIYVDGSRDLSPQSRDPFNLEQVEVVKGPSSATTGRGSTGGTINLVSKTPLFTPKYNVDFSLGSDKTKRITGDVNFPLERLGLGERTAFRMNGVYHDSNVAGRDVIENNRWGLAPTLTFGVGRNSTFTLGYFHMTQDNIADYGIPWVPVTNNALVPYRDRPAPVPRETFYGFKDRDNEFLKSNLATIAFYHTFNDNLNLRNQLRYGRSTRDSVATPPRFGNVNSSAVTREMRAWETIDETYDNQTDFTAKFKTFGLEHALVTGAEFVREKNTRYARAAKNVFTTLFNPNPNDIYTDPIFKNPLPGEVVASTQSVYLLDTITFHPKLEFNGSIRYDRYDADGLTAGAVSVNQTTGAPTIGTAQTAFAKLDNLFNYRAALVYKPIEIGSIYASYGTAVNPSLSGLIYDNATITSLNPEETNTLEFGTKWDLLENRILLTGAIFRVEKTNARTPLPDGTSQILDGKQRVNGFELGITGNITRDWSILTGYTLLDSRIIESNAFTVVNNVRFYEQGRRFINTPRNSFSLWSTYQLPFRLNVGGGARYVDKRFGNNINTRFVDSYWLLEGTASYQINKYIDVRVNGYNLANKFYFDRITGGQVVPGPGRSVLVSTAVHF